MFQRVVTTVSSNGEVTQSREGSIDPYDVERDMAETRRRVSKIARGSEGRISSVEETVATLVVIYTSGAVKVHHWVPGN